MITKLSDDLFLDFNDIKHITRDPSGPERWVISLKDGLLIGVGREDIDEISKHFEGDK